MPDQSSRTGRPRIAVAGATGRVGAALVARLAADPVDVVALTRTPEMCRMPPGIDVAMVDFDVPLTLSDALQGADRFFLAHGTSERQVANEIALIDAAVSAGISHIVKLSAMGPPTRLHPFDWHAEIESHLAKCDVGYTVLRPSCFMSVLERAQHPVAEDSWGGAAGEGLVNLIDTRDVADVARVALLDEHSPGSQRAYHLTGPEAVSMQDVAEELSRLLGRKIAYHHRTAAEQRRVLISSGATEMAADVRLGLEKIFRESVLAETTNTVAELTGNGARPVETWLRDNLPGFMSESG